ncbi:MAG: hypothetical protein IT454_16205 [Planctomycetes bacterium]|nr:hypothetical protein [Planctomycetota bacterium]
MKRLSSIALGLFSLAASASAQCFNIDTGFISTPPSNAYGAASGMSGVWNDVGATPAAFALLDIDGAPTCATLTASTLGGVPAAATAPLIPVTAPDDAALYNDFALVPGPLGVTTWTIAGLDPGTYDVYVYSLSPFAATNPTLLSCINFASGKTICGTWPGVGAPTVGAAFVVDPAVVLIGLACTNTISFTSSVFAANPFGCVNGIQIVRRGGGCPARYCQSGTSGAGCVPVLSFGGPNPPSVSVWTNGFVIDALNLDGQKQGLFFYSVTGTKAVPWCGAAGSYLCVRAPVNRLAPGNTGGSAGVCNGTLSVDWNAWISTHTGELGEPWGVGDDVWIQCWYRDPLTPCSNVTSNMTEALHFQLEL